MSTLLALVLASAASAPVDPRDRAYQAHSAAEAQSLLGVENPEAGPRLLLEAPDIVAGTGTGAGSEGVAVHIKLTSRMPGVDWMALLLENSNTPLLVHRDFTPGAEQTLETDARLTGTARVRALARVSGKYYQVSREIKVARPEHAAATKP